MFLDVLDVLGDSSDPLREGAMPDFTHGQKSYRNQSRVVRKSVGNQLEISQGADRNQSGVVQGSTRGRGYSAAPVTEDARRGLE